MLPTSQITLVINVGRTVSLCNVMHHSHKRMESSIFKELWLILLITQSINEKGLIKYLSLQL